MSPKRAEIVRERAFKRAAPLIKPKPGLVDGPGFQLNRGGRFGGSFELVSGSGVGDIGGKYGVEWMVAVQARPAKGGHREQ